MPNPFKTKEFKLLQKDWYQKLASSGFEDIENNKLPEPALKKWDNHVFKAHNKLVLKDKTAYFESARALLQTYHFESELEHRVWELHSEGHSERSIAEIMNRPKFRKSNVHTIVAKIREELK